MLPVTGKFSKLDIYNRYIDTSMLSYIIFFLRNKLKSQFKSYTINYKHKSIQLFKMYYKHSLNNAFRRSK